MSAPLLFIGVVSHEDSRYASAQGPSGLAFRLTQALTARGISVQVAVETSNIFDPVSNRITRRDIQEALKAQVRLEDDWVTYVHQPYPRGLEETLRSLLRWGLRGWRQVFPPKGTKYERLLNIEFSHQALMKQALEKGAEWILILEDDAWSDSVHEVGLLLDLVLNNAPPAVKLISLSESFGVSRLGVNRLLTEVCPSWWTVVNRRLASAERPVTNTVCALLYRSDFTRQLLSVFDAMGVKPILPIDWKLNRALMSMHASGELGADSCWWIVPGPIDQLSMRGDS